MKIVLGEEHVIVRGMTYEENCWGQYQFPIAYRDGDKIVVSVHVEDDTIVTTGNPTLWFESCDKGKTWKEVPFDKVKPSGITTPNGDRLFFPTQGGTIIDGYEWPGRCSLTPEYDFSKKAQPNEMPYFDGITAWWVGESIRAYNADRLPYPLDKKVWAVDRIKAGTNEKVREEAKLDWPNLTRVVFHQGGKYVMKPINPRGIAKIGPDNNVWISSFTGEGHIIQKNGQYSPYYAGVLFKSTDNGKSFSLVSQMEYPADGDKYPYLSGGFSDNDFVFLEDGSMVWFFRSAWFGSTGNEVAPMYCSKSFDLGKTWSKPEIFDFCGVFPRTCKLSCGATLITYGRPGIFVRGSFGKCDEWGDRLEIVKPIDRSGLANVVKPKKDQGYHDWDGLCGNSDIIAVDENTALVVYTDFYYPDENGVKKKTVLAREIKVINE